MKVRIRDFQSIEDVKLDINGFTLLVGESSQGKSACFRALQASVMNRFRAGQVRNGSSATEVGIRFDSGDVLKVTKGVKESATMVLNGREYSKLSRTVPSEVSVLCNMEPLGTDKDVCSLNFHPQFEAPMLLGYSQSKVVELLSASSALEDLNMVKGGLLDRRSECKGRFTSLDAILSRLKEEVSDLERRVDSSVDRVSELRTIKDLYEDLVRRIGLCESYRKGMEFVARVSSRVKMIDDIESLLKADVWASNELLGSFIDTGVQVESMSDRVVVLDGVIGKLEEMVSVGDVLSSVRSRISALDSYRVLGERVSDYGRRMVELARVLDEGCCPICGAKLGECND